jgi:hypothetical protein
MTDRTKVPTEEFGFWKSEKKEPCEHDFSGWREFDDGRGGEQFCQKCGLGAMQWSMRFLP